MKTKLFLLLTILLITGCTNDDSPNRKLEKDIVGNKYAHLNFETREECESANESYFMNCAQVLEIINDSEVQIYLTDIMYRTSFYIENRELIVESSSETYEIPENLIFTILENGNLKLDGDSWIKYEVDFYN